MTKALLYTLASAPGTTRAYLLLQARPQLLRRALRVNQLRTARPRQLEDVLGAAARQCR